VTASGHEVTDGPFVEAKEWLVGFYLVECEDEAQAVGARAAGVRRRAPRRRGAPRHLAVARVTPADAVRRVYPRVLATLLGFTRSLPDAEDAAHDAVERALASWPVAGVPDSPEAWLVTVGRNAHRDRARRARKTDSHGDPVEVVARLSPRSRLVTEADTPHGFGDELLRLLFACCHPALEDGESAALALATVVGLSSEEIGRAFVVAPRSLEQRLTRARRRLREHGDPDGTTAEEGRPPPPRRPPHRPPAVHRGLLVR
jgi:RNA polymerase sigma factor (sigma-70 family)